MLIFYVVLLEPNRAIHWPYRYLTRLAVIIPLAWLLIISVFYLGCVLLYNDYKSLLPHIIETAYMTVSIYFVAYHPYRKEIKEADQFFRVAK